MWVVVGWTLALAVTESSASADPAVKDKTRVIILDTGPATETNSRAPSNVQPHDALPPMYEKTRRSSFMVHDATGWLLLQRKDPQHAKVTANCGLISVAEADYGKDHITVMKLRSPLAALCALSNAHTLDALRLDHHIGANTEAFRSGGMYFGRSEEFVVILRTVGSTSSSGLLDVVMSELPRSTTKDPEIAALDILPQADRIPGSERYIPSTALGFYALGAGFAADFACREGSATLAYLHNADPQRVSAEFIEEASKRGLALRHANSLGAQLTMASDATSSYPQLVTLVRVGQRLAAVESDVPLASCGESFANLVKNLRQAASVAAAPAEILIQ